jgi:copper chaperone CopZ
VRVSLISVNGVASVEVSLDKGLATVKLRPGNTVSLKQLHDAIAKNGFTMKQSRITAAGKVTQAAGGAKFQISGSNDLLSLVQESPTVPSPATNTSATFLVEGTIPESTKDKVPDSVRYRSLTEEK